MDNESALEPVIASDAILDVWREGSKNPTSASCLLVHLIDVISLSPSSSLCVVFTVGSEVEGQKDGTRYRFSPGGGFGPYSVQY